MRRRRLRAWWVRFRHDRLGVHMIVHEWNDGSPWWRCVTCGKVSHSWNGDSGYYDPPSKIVLP